MILMRRLMVFAAILTAFSQSTAVALGDGSSAGQREPISQHTKPLPQANGNGLCRRAPILPQMENEAQGQTVPAPSPRPGRWTPRREVAPEFKPFPAPAVGGMVPPPAPPPPPSEMGERVRGESAASAVAAAPMSPSSSTIAPATKRAPTTSTDRALAPRTPGHGSPQQVQSGQLTAGEHDDLLNPALYARYVSQFLAGETLAGIPRVDTGKVLSVIVQDSAGAPVPFANVTLTCSDGNTLSLTTMADGRAVFFPELDRLGDNVFMTAGLGQSRNSPSRNINVTGVRGAQEVRTRLSARAPKVTKFDLAVVIDATGSMGDEIAFLKAELADIIVTLSRRHRGLDVRVALVVYRDQGDEFVTRTFAFTSDLGVVQRNLSAQSASGGGDMPEAMEVAMARAVGLDWRSDAVKSMLLVADAPPHSGDVPATWAATEVARAKRIQIVPVAASGVDDAAQYIMRAMAAATQSRYAFLTDDSGIGNAHAEPSVDCYHVTKLDSLLARILDAQISGRRIEPESQEIVRTVGDYDNGKCRGA
jgi:Mg-chelatase subunit ChlD